MRLSPRDFSGVLRLLPALYEQRQSADFFRNSLQLLQLLVCADVSGWTMYEMSNGPQLAVLVELEPRPTPQLVAMLEGIASRPFPGYWMTFQDPTALMLSDFPERVRQAHRWSAEEANRLLEMEHDLTLPIAFDAEQAVSLSFFRKTRPFTERDRLVVNLLQPHLRQAYANSQLLDKSLDNDRSLRSSSFLDCDLTSRERNVSYWLAQGKTNWEIGLILGISARTVEKHVERVLNKLHVENRTAAAIRIHEAIESRSRLACETAVSRAETRAVRHASVSRADSLDR